MPHYAITDDKAGEFHENCSQCGLVFYGDSQDAELLDLPSHHAISEITVEEKQELNESRYEVERNGKIILVDDFEELEQSELANMSLKHKNKLDVNKATTHVKDRDKTKDGMPVKIIVTKNKK